MSLSLVNSFMQNGYVVLPGLVDAPTLGALRDAVDSALSPPLAPLEYEAEVGYPGAPVDINAPGGATPRRLLSAFSRDPVFRSWARNATVHDLLKTLLGTQEVVLSQNHHNCVMTKYPGYSSCTSWHRDMRYWSFDRPELINVWTALGDEQVHNGALSILPGSHKEDLDRGRLDAKLFLREDLADNAQLIGTAVPAPLMAGDVLVFHSRVFHAAGANQTERIKTSLVYTYRAADNLPIPQTRSAKYPDIPL